MNCQSLFLTLKLIPLRPEAYGVFFRSHDDSKHIKNVKLLVLTSLRPHSWLKHFGQQLHKLRQKRIVLVVLLAFFVFFIFLLTLTISTFLMSFDLCVLGCIVPDHMQTMASEVSLSLCLVCH